MRLWLTSAVDGKCSDRRRQKDDRGAVHNVGTGAKHDGMLNNSVVLG